MSATLLKVTFLQRCFSRFLNCRNGTKLRKACDILWVWMSFKRRDDNKQQLTNISPTKDLKLQTS